MSGDPESESQIRWSARLKGERSFGDGATYEHVTFYQPVVDDFGDYVIEITNSVTTTLIGNLSLAVEHLYLRDSAPPPGAAADDQKAADAPARQRGRGPRERPARARPARRSAKTRSVASSLCRGRRCVRRFSGCPKRGWSTSCPWAMAWSSSSERARSPGARRPPSITRKRVLPGGAAPWKVAEG